MNLQTVSNFSYIEINGIHLPPHSANSVVAATEDSRCEPGAVCSQVRVSVYVCVCVCVCVCGEGAHSVLSLTVPVINVTTLCSPCITPVLP